MLMGRVMAGIDLIGRTGATDFELAHDEDPVQWWAGANWNGTRMFSERFPYPAQAVEDLVGRVVNGGRCTHCDLTTVVGVTIGGHCCQWLSAENVDDPNSYRWVRSCQATGELPS